MLLLTAVCMAQEHVHCCGPQATDCIICGQVHLRQRILQQFWALVRCEAELQHGHLHKLLRLQAVIIKGSCAVNVRVSCSRSLTGRQSLGQLSIQHV